MKTFRERQRWSESIEWVMIGVVLILAGVLLYLILSSRAHAATVNVQWQASPASDVAGYRLYRADRACANAGTTAFRPVKTIPATSTFASDVVGKGTYCYRLTVYDIAGNESGPSVKRQVTILQDSGPAGFLIHSVAP